MKPTSAEMRFEATGRTDRERDELIMKLWKRGLSCRAIADQTGMSAPGVHYAIQRLRGRPRRRAKPADDWDESEWYAPD